MPKTEILPKSYSKLLSELKSILIQGLRVIEQERVRTYWKTGELISQHLLEINDRAKYGEELFVNLSRDLNIANRSLRYATQFYQAYTNLQTFAELTWSHYLVLLTIQDSKKRISFQNQAIKNQWSVRDLKQAIARSKPVELPPPKKPVAKLSVKRGKLGVYRLITADYTDGLVLDLGFNLRKKAEFKGVSKPQAGDIVESNRYNRVGCNGEHWFKRSGATKSKLYTYLAFLERVVDGDTIWVNIDLGFNSFARQKLRFRGIDTPEIYKKKGVEAKQFVEKVLGAVDFMIIKTYSPDKYGRYLVDIFYGDSQNPQEVLETGTFLNQKLLDFNLAKLV